MAAAVTWRWTCTQEDFDAMVALVERHGGKTQGDRRAEDGLRPAGERSIYLFDPGQNRLQITAHARIRKKNYSMTKKNGAASSPARKEQGKGLTRWESGGKKLV